MVVRTRLRAFFRQTALFLGTAAAIAYFSFHAFNGNHGLMARRHYDEQKRDLTAELARLQGEHSSLERRVALMKASSIDPDMLDEKSREMLGLVEADDVIVFLPGKR
jgi:cell division protein FtsB